ISFKQRHELLRAVGRDDLVADPRFATPAALNEPGRLPELYEIVAAEAIKIKSADFIAEMNARSVPCSPVLTPEEVLEDEHVRETGIVKEWTDPVHGRVRTPSPPMKFEKDPLDPKYELRPLGADG